MRKLAVVAAVLALTGCMGGKEKSMENVCKDLVLLEVVDPSSAVINNLRLSSREASREDVIRGLYGSESDMSQNQKKFLDLIFDDENEGATERLVSIDYTDKSSSDSIRGDGRCLFIEYGDGIYLTRFWVGGVSVNNEQLSSYLVGKKRPKGLTFSGRLE